MTKKLYDDDYLLQLQSILSATVKRSLEVLGAKPGEQIADMGCGTGILAKSIADSGAAVYGIDNDAHFLSIARENNHPVYPVQFIQASAGNTGLPAACLDKIIIHRVLQHIENPEEVIMECKRLLKPGGRLHIVEPDYLSWSFLMEHVVFERKLIDEIAYHRLPNAHKVRLMPTMLKKNHFDISIREVHNYILDSYELANYVIKFDNTVEEGLATNKFTKEEYDYWQQIKQLPKGQFALSVNLVMIDSMLKEV